MKLPLLPFVGLLALLAGLTAAPAAQAAVVPASPALALKPDITVAADGSGDFKTIQEAIASIPKDNRERVVVFIKDGLYHERLRIDPAFVTLQGQSRAGTRIEFAQPRAPDADPIGVGVVNINGDDCVLANLTIENTHGVIGVHAFAVYGRGDRTVITDSNVWSQGNDTLSLWRTGSGLHSEDAENHVSPNGRYYHARLDVRGSVDFICPRGWCYMVDSTMHEVNPNAEAAMWHDGSRDRDMKFVMRNCTFDGVEGWRFARHHHDAMIFIINGRFSKAMRDLEPARVIYPLKGGPPSAADTQKNKERDPTNIWGERFYYFNAHRDGGDYAWHKDNLATAPGAPKPDQITAKWTFGGRWDPENKEGPAIKNVAARDGQIAVTFSEGITVKGKPRLALRGGGFADYASGSGTDILWFAAPAAPAGSRGAPEKIELQGGAIIATEAAATLRVASLKLP